MRKLLDPCSTVKSSLLNYFTFAIQGVPFTASTLHSTFILKWPNIEFFNIFVRFAVWNVHWWNITPRFKESIKLREGNVSWSESLKSFFSKSIHQVRRSVISKPKKILRLEILKVCRKQGSNKDYNENSQSFLL